MEVGKSNGRRRSFCLAGSQLSTSAGWKRYMHTYSSYDLKMNDWFSKFLCFTSDELTPYLDVLCDNPISHKVLPAPAHTSSWLQSDPTALIDKYFIPRIKMRHA